MENKTLTVNYPGGQYEIVVGSRLLPQVRALAGIQGPLAVVTDSNVGPLYAAQIPDAACVITVPAGEQHKTLETVRTIYDQLLAAGLDRKGTVVALGGGVVGDMAGFAAASYMRGIDFVPCPTSLLAMVDASVGGKTGVDLPQGKNLVGAFKQPTAVLADVDTLSTLPPEEFAAGMAEVIKHGLIDGPGLLGRVEEWEAAEQEQRGRGAEEQGGGGVEKRETEHGLLTTDHRLPIADSASLVYEAIQVKQDVVQEDPFEQGRRAVLNLGHTFGHAIEQVSGYTIRHGEGVAMGLVAAANLSARLGHCDPALQDRIEVVLARWRLPTRIPGALEPAALYRAMGSDKKKAAGRLRFILLRGVGDVFVTGDVLKTAVLETLAAVQA